MCHAKQFQIQRGDRVRFWLGCLIGFIQLTALATQNLTLAWDASVGPNVAGYNIYYGTVSHKYDSKVSVGNVTTTTISGLVAGTTYYLAVSAYDISNVESALSDEAVITMPTNPSTTSSNLSSNGTISAGQSVTFSLTNVGAASLNCQWEFNGNAIVCATNTSLTLSNVTAAQAGKYSVTVSGGSGCTNSTTASLMVYSSSAATLEQPIYANGQFSFNAVGVPGNQYIVQFSTNQLNWVSLQTNTTPFTFVDPNAGQSTMGFYRACNYTNATASLTVNLSVDPTTVPPTMTQSTYVGGQFSFSVSGVTNQQYVVEASTNLVNWFPLQTNAAPFTFTDTNASQFSQCFYRAFLLSE